VFVRDQDSVQTFRTHANGFKSLGDLARTEPGVNKQPALICGN
jgi:hypothetical protein